MIKLAQIAVISLLAPMLPSNQVAAILHTKPLSSDDARDLARNALEEMPLRQFHFRLIGNKGVLVSEEILPVEQSGRAIKFLRELSDTAKRDSCIFHTDDFSDKARRALLSNFTPNRPEGVSLDAKGEIAIQMMSEMVLKSGEKEIRIPWRPEERLPVNQIDLQPAPNQDPNRIVKEKFALRFPFEPQQYTLHNLTQSSHSRRADNAKLWSQIFESVAKEVDELYKEYAEAVSICRSQMISRYGDPAVKVNGGKLSPKDVVALTKYINANAAHFGFESADDVDAFMASMSIKSQRYLLEVTVKHQQSGYITSGIDMGTAPR